LHAAGAWLLLVTLVACAPVESQSVGTGTAPIEVVNPDHEVRIKAGCQVNNGGCHLDATCTVDTGQVACTCKPGFAGDGRMCAAIPTPVGAVLFTTPTMRGDAAGSVQKYPGETAVAAASDPTGVAVDAAGNIYFGEVTAAPVRVNLKKRSPDGDVADLGVVVDTAGGIVSATWTFDVATSAAGDVYYTTPAIITTSGTVLQPGSVRKLGGGVIVDVVDSPAGLAVDAAGNLYFGSMTAGPVRVTLMRRGLDGSVSSLGTVVDASAGYLPAAWTFDIATTRSGDVLFTTPNIASGSGVGIVRPGTIEKLGTGAIVENVDSTVGLAVDADGNVYFGSLTVAPLRVSLRKWTVADGSVTDLGTVVDTSAGGVTLGWGFDLATSLR
jgi:hypothetical protein